MEAAGGTIIVVAAVIEDDGKFLVCQRPLHKRHGGLWEFPGGKLEPGEGYFEAAEREIHEELGLTVTAVGRTLFTMEDAGSHFVIHFVDVKVEPGLIEMHEHIAVAWLTASQLRFLNMAPSDEKFVEFLNANH